MENNNSFKFWEQDYPREKKDICIAEAIMRTAVENGRPYSPINIYCPCSKCNTAKY